MNSKVIPHKVYCKIPDVNNVIYLWNSYHSQLTRQLNRTSWYNTYLTRIFEVIK